MELALSNTLCAFFRYNNGNKSHRFYFLIIFGLFLCVSKIRAQDMASLSPSELKKLSIEELMAIEVTSVSKHPEKLTEVASAIQVIRNKDIHRSTATSLPEALRLAPNLHVAQLNSYAWVISSRGFNTLYANKLLVMIDGRTVYTPLFAGVFWDAQNVLLEDVERIEVVSGPGGTLWGANAVNGVINVLTKSAGETQGLYASGSVGSMLRNNQEVRYGGQIGDNFCYRVYGKHFDLNHTVQADDQDVADKWGLYQGGFRIDWELSKTDNLTFQGDYYIGDEKTVPRQTDFDGQNVLGRWTHIFSDRSQLVAQAYFDRTWRRMPTISFALATYDIDIQHHFSVGERHRVMVGVGYRLMQDDTQNYTTAAGILPNERDMHLFNGFVQDEISIVPETFKITVGSKLSHNIFTDFEVQPSVRITWTPDKDHTVWGAVSRAVRTPSRIDVDYYIPTNPAPGAPQVAGGPNFNSEKVIAYELGYRVRPAQAVSLSLATFYNVYDDIYSVEALPGTLTYQIQNGSEAQSEGVELSGNYQAASWWRLRGGYTYLKMDIRNKPGHDFDPTILANDAEHRFLVQSIIDLPWNLNFDLTARYTDKLPRVVPDYFTFDARLAWSGENVELSIAGQNLWEDKHQEFGLIEIPRNIYGTLKCRF
ncbi:TonB-dependent receptor [Fulvivirga imtechensis AK7]|uniref:TonB-dependent receptor n=1 Tax=Fulvivirga imtechensis AK7 TaxID=1237149 RepID=L8JU09_9BACT|nr:TonB-dependent receptor [Fulvivirga imtechensis]ELR72501.1 TonB-dependent receptor [Fulvivirga imtechensis AK7]